MLSGWTAWQCWLAGVGLTALLGLALIPVARRAGWLDHPSARKVHARPTPLAGGLAIFIAFFSLLYLCAGELAGNPRLTALLLGCAIVLVTGLTDDRRPLSARLRFLAQGAACSTWINQAMR